MSFTFYGRGPDGERITPEGSAFLNVANGNLLILLSLLGLDRPAAEEGEVDLPTARRAIIYAKATIERRASALERPTETLEAPGAPLAVVHGVDRAYLDRRLTTFERLVAYCEERKATAIYWD